VSTDGLRWSLRAADLVPGSSLGLSNMFVETRARVQVKAGVVLAIRPRDVG
jgi:thiamine pyrophosphokinase